MAEAESVIAALHGAGGIRKPPRHPPHRGRPDSVPRMSTPWIR
jgi:hypothetical protein